MKCVWHFDKWQQSKGGGKSAETKNKAVGVLIINLGWQTGNWKTDIFVVPSSFLKLKREKSLREKIQNKTKTLQGNKSLFHFFFQDDQTQSYVPTWNSHTEKAWNSERCCLCPKITKSGSTGKADWALHLCLVCWNNEKKNLIQISLIFPLISSPIGRHKIPCEIKSGCYF